MSHNNNPCPRLAFMVFLKPEADTFSQHIFHSQKKSSKITALENYTTKIKIKLASLQTCHVNPSARSRDKLSGLSQFQDGGVRSCHSERGKQTI